MVDLPMIIVNIIIYIFDTNDGSNTQIRLFTYTVNMFPVSMPKYADLISLNFLS